jgi:cytochrome c nitrite reductase small subunit
MKLPLFVGILALLSVVGTGMVVTDFTSYLGSDPKTCNNCHVMDTVYEGWYHAGHQDWATCSDCHTPHALIPKYIVKAQSGFRHVSAFTLGTIPEAIRAHESTREIVQANCIYCHQETVANIVDSPMQGERTCFECHRDVAHGPRGLSAQPYSEDGK